MWSGKAVGKEFNERDNTEQMSSHGRKLRTCRPSHRMATSKTASIRIANLRAVTSRKLVSSGSRWQGPFEDKSVLWHVSGKT